VANSKNGDVIQVRCVECPSAWNQGAELRWILQRVNVRQKLQSTLRAVTG